MKRIITFLLSFLFAVASKAQCMAKNDDLKDSQLSSQQSVFDNDRAQQIDAVLSYLTSKYKTPLLYYYKPDWNNACYNPNDDHLYFGTSLMNELFQTGGVSAMAFVVCHEYSHFCQARFPNDNSIVNGTVRINELQADFVASYFFGDLVSHNVVKFNEDIDMIGLAQAIFNTGDNAFTDTSHHGTWAERTLTMFLTETTDLGTEMPNDLQKIFSFANKYYTKFGIIACGSATPIPGSSPVLGVGTLYNEYSGEECVIGIDFKLYAIRHKNYWGGIEFNSTCTPIGEIEYASKQIMNASDEGLGFYVKMYPDVPYYPKRFFLYKKSVFEDESMKDTAAPYLYWQTKTLNG